MTEETSRKDFSTQAIAYRLVDYITRLHYPTDHFLFAKQKNMPPQMEYGHSEKMRLQIQRMEHTVRCFILFLVTEFFAAKIPLPYEQKERQTHAPKTFDERSEEQQYDDLHGRPLRSLSSTSRERQKKRHHFLSHLRIRAIAFAAFIRTIYDFKFESFPLPDPDSLTKTEASGVKSNERPP